jgi:ribosomal protein L34E
MPAAQQRLTGSDVDALLFGTPSQGVAGEGGATAPGRPWRYPAWPKCDRCNFRDGAVTSHYVKVRSRSYRVWLCEWCLREVTKEEVMADA